MTRQFDNLFPGKLSTGLQSYPQAASGAEGAPGRVCSGSGSPAGTISRAVLSIDYHLVLVTMCRRKVLDAAMFRDFEAHARERVEVWDRGLIEVNGDPDHVHFLQILPHHLQRRYAAGDDHSSA